jgi:transposase
MSKMLHNEARELLVEGYAKTHDVEAIAKAFSVSKWTVYHLVEQKCATGSVELRTNQRGRKRLLNEDDKTHISNCIDEKPDITIEEIRETLHLSASYSTVQRAIVGLGYSFKKKMIHASEQERPRCAGKTCTMGRECNLGYDQSPRVS